MKGIKINERERERKRERRRGGKRDLLSYNNP